MQHDQTDHGGQFSPKPKEEHFGGPAEGLSSKYFDHTPCIPSHGSRISGQYDTMFLETGKCSSECVILIFLLFRYAKFILVEYMFKT